MMSVGLGLGYLWTLLYQQDWYCSIGGLYHISKSGHGTEVSEGLVKEQLYTV